MKRYKSIALLAAGALIIQSLVGSGGSLAAYAAGTQPVKEQSFAADLKAAEDTDQLIVAIGDGSSKVTVSYHSKDGNGRWSEIFSTPGVYGKNGATADKKEGDGKTPLGTYQFTMAFGVKDDPGSILPYHKLINTDYWVDDSDSRYYNQMVDAKKVKKDWNSAEKMSDGAPFYNYGLALNYNPECTPGKGSAIFLHCTRSSADTGSQGCIRIPEEQVKTLLKSVDDKTRIVIVSDISQLEYK